MCIDSKDCAAFNTFTCARRILPKRVCFKSKDEATQKPQVFTSNSTQLLKRLVIAMLQEVQDKELCDCINDEHLNLGHHVHPTLTVGEIRGAAKELGITAF